MKKLLSILSATALLLPRWRSRWLFRQRGQMSLLPLFLLLPRRHPFRCSPVRAQRHP